MQVVDARTNQAVASLSHPNFRTATNFARSSLSPSALYASAASSNGNVYMWDISNPEGEAAIVLETHGASAMGSDWCLNMPSTLASCDAAGGLRIWA